MAKFNKVSALLPSIGSEISNLEEYHSQITEIEKRIKQDHLEQQENLLAAARRVRDEVL